MKSSLQPNLLRILHPTSGAKPDDPLSGTGDMPNDFGKMFEDVSKKRAEVPAERLPELKAEAATAELPAPVSVKLNFATPDWPNTGRKPKGGAENLKLPDSETASALSSATIAVAMLPQFLSIETVHSRQKQEGAVSISPVLPLQTSTLVLPGSDTPLHEALVPREDTPKAIQVSVVGSETHFAPVLDLPVSRQLGEKIIGIADAGQAVAANAEIPFQRPVSSSHILDIRLEPADLGTVTMRLRLSGKSLSVHLDVERSETLQMIDGDQNTLAETLRAAGYTLDSLKAVPSVAANDDTTRFGVPRSPSGSGPGSSPEGAQSGGRPGEGFSGSPNENPRGRERQSGKANHEMSITRINTGASDAVSGIYV